MDLEKLQEQADKDLKINDTELDLESLKTPQLHNQYMKHLTKYKLMLSRAETEYSVLKREKWEYYTGKADASVYAQKPFDLKWDRIVGTHQIGFQDKRGKAKNKPTLNKKEANHTPILFRDELIRLAKFSKIESTL